MTRQDILDALQALADTGGLTPSRLVAAAKSPAHPLHDRFPWDDKKAAHEHRLSIARHIIVSVHIKPAGSRVPIQVYVNVPDPSGKGEGEYVHTEVLVRQPERWQLARDQVIRYLSAASQSLDSLDEAMRLYGSPRPQDTKRAVSARASITRARDAITAIST